MPLWRTEPFLLFYINCCSHCPGRWQRSHPNWQRYANALPLERQILFSRPVISAVGEHVQGSITLPPHDPASDAHPVVAPIIQQPRPGFRWMARRQEYPDSQSNPLSRGWSANSWSHWTHKYPHKAPWWLSQTHFGTLAYFCTRVMTWQLQVFSAYASTPMIKYQHHEQQSHSSG